ncbi:MAG: DUF4874 domain-containing protein, partial [Chthonomonadales bacterium]|nr:DUF4874 domain-containing protein [Chthonomonadales bacterium]
MPESATLRYRGIRPTDPNGRRGLRNPERGFRTETLIAEPPGRTEGVWGIPAHLWNRVGPGFSRVNWLADLRRFEPDGVTLTQAYCYLTEYHDGPIADAKLRSLQHTFDALREAGAKCVLRFAYIKDYPAHPEPPTVERMLQHMQQLRPIVARNADMIHTVEAGFVAAWGEWHVNAHVIDADARARLLDGILRMTPPGVFVQVRYPGIKTGLVPRIALRPYRPLSDEVAFGTTPEARIGHHDDGVLTAPRGMEGYAYAREPAELGDLRDLVRSETLFVPM